MVIRCRDIEYVLYKEHFLQVYEIHRLYRSRKLTAIMHMVRESPTKLLQGGQLSIICHKVWSPRNWKWHSLCGVYTVYCIASLVMSVCRFTSRHYVILWVFMILLVHYPSPPLSLSMPTRCHGWMINYKTLMTTEDYVACSNIHRRLHV